MGQSHDRLRHFLECGLRAIVLATGLVAMGCATANQGAFEKVISGQSRLVDLSHALEPGIPAEGTDEGFEVVTIRTLSADGAYVNRFAMAETTGTNLEAPARLVSSTPSVDKLPARQFLGYAVVINVESKVVEQHDYVVTRNDIELWESDHGAIPPESIVLLRTGWSERWSDPEKYFNRNEQGVPVYPGISSDAVNFLLRERRVHGLGIDTMSLYVGSGNEPGQRAFLVAGKYHINNLVNLDQLPARGAVIMAIPLSIRSGSGAPARVLAIVPQEQTAIEPGKKKVEQSTESGMDRSQPGRRY